MIFRPSKNFSAERYFVLVLLCCTGLALSWPMLFLWFKPWIMLGLGVVIFSIGIHMSPTDLLQPFTKPGAVLALVLIRYALMPCTAYGLAQGFALTPTETIGLMVVGTAPGGAAANIMAYLAKANVGLTVLLTVASTLVSPLITPALIYFFLHQRIHIDFSAMMGHIAMIIFIPIIMGVLCNHLRWSWVTQMKQKLPLCAMLMVAMMVATIVAWNQAAMLQFPLKLLCAVLVLNGVGYLIGAAVSYALHWEYSSMLAVIFDYGMFDGAIAIMICTLYFGADTALAAVLMGILQNITAPILIRHQPRRVLTRRRIKI